MKYSLLGLCAAAAVSAHYQFPDLITGGTVSSDFQFVRETVNHYDNSPVTDVTDDSIRCFELAGRPAAGVATVAAGSSIGFKANLPPYHPGPLSIYMAKVPSGQAVDSWVPSGNVWFKVYQDKATVSSSGLSWPNTNQPSFSFTIPKSLPTGNYLVRIEQIGLHVASTVNGAQFYLACGQVSVTGGGSGTPSPLVSFPGAYSPTDPGILINLYYPIPTSYTPPGPPVWTG